MIGGACKKPPSLPALGIRVYVLDRKGIFNPTHEPSPLVEKRRVMNIFCDQSCGKVAENWIKSLIRLKNLSLPPDRTNVGNATDRQKNARGVRRGQT
jgi:hypothetical protein